MASYPEWVLKHKQPGTEIRCLSGRYYVYRITSVWNKEKKRADKKTIGFLGTITENGFIGKIQTYEKPLSIEDKWQSKIAVKEFGASNMLLTHITKDISTKLQQLFPNVWKELLVISILRIIHQCPMKNIDNLYYDSDLSNKYSGLELSGKNISLLLKYIGAHRVEMVDFMKSFITGGEHIVFDVTSITSSSGKLEINQSGYNSKRNFDPQINLLYVFSVNQQEPRYYRIIPGNIRDITAFKLGIKESGLTNAIIIADKGFSSQSNIKLLQDENLAYIIPLKHNNNLIQYDPIKSGDYKKFDGYFMFKHRCIWHYSYQQGDQQLITFIDESLKQEESKDYLIRVDEEYEGYTKEEFFNKQHKFGTITITVTQSHCNYNIIVVDNLFALKRFIKNNVLANEIHNHTIIFVKNKRQLYIHYQENDKSQITSTIISINADLCTALGEKIITTKTAEKMLTVVLNEHKIPMLLWDAKKVYYYLKNRMQIETSFDAYKNILHADRTYMQNQQSLEAWMFINHLALMYYYKVYQLLLKNDMLSKYSPIDILTMLLQIRTLKIDGTWITAEISAKMSKLMTKLGVPITY